MQDADIPRLTAAEVQQVIADAAERGDGLRLFHAGRLSHLSRYQNKLFCHASGTTPGQYKVALAFGDRQVQARCTCFAARSRPFCKHGAALLWAWARAPESFTVADAAALDGLGLSPRRKATRQGKVQAGALMGQGLEQVATLVRELAAAGLSTVNAERVAQIRGLGEGLRQNKLRRLSGRTIALSELLAQATAGQGGFDPSAYADLLSDLLLTTRKLARHLAGEALDNRYVEELIGKTWSAKDRQPVSDLHLVEYAFLSQVTPDGFQIRESRFVDVASGCHYSEKQILPLQLVRRTDPKPSYFGQVLLGARGGIYPGFAPLRLKIEDLGTPAVLGAEALEPLVQRALSVSAALAAFQEQRKDVFAPDRLPVSVRAAALFAEGQTLRAIDGEGAGLSLPWARDPHLELRFSSVLRGARLLALLGEIDVDDALPTLHPLAAVVAVDTGLQLRPLTALQGEGRPRRGARTAGPGRVAPSMWVEAARRCGASEAVVALAEVRQELALLCAQGLGGLSARQVDPLALRLSELGMARQAALLQGAAARTDIDGRLEDIVKLYQVLDLALVRLCSAAHVDRAALEPVPTYDGVEVRRIERTLPPVEVVRLQTAGALGRYEAAAHLARYYAGLTAAELAASVYPTWADGSATPYVVRALAQPPLFDEAVAAAGRVLRGRGLLAKATAVQVLRVVGTPAAVALLQQAARGEFDNPRSFAAADFWYWERGGTVSPLRVAAGQGLEALALRSGALSRAAQLELSERRRRHQATLAQHLALSVSATTQDQQREAVWELAKLGDAQAAPTLRMIASGESAASVRPHAIKALGLLGDAESADFLISLLSQRDHEPDLARSAAYALGYLGDARGIAELLHAFAEGWQPMVVGEALRAVGGVCLMPLLELLEARPQLLERKAVGDVVRGVPTAEVVDELCQRLEQVCAAGAEPASWLERARVLLRVAGKVPAALPEVARRALLLLAGRDGEAAEAVRKLVHKELSRGAA